MQFPPIRLRSGLSMLVLSFLMMTVLSSCDKGFLAPEQETSTFEILVKENERRSSPLDTAAVEFPKTRVNDESSQTFTIKNTGEHPLRLGNITTDQAYFQVIEPEISVIEAGESADFEVKFLPGNWGEYYATVGFFTDAQDGQAYNFEVVGTGTLAPELTTDNMETETPDGLNTVPFNDFDGNGTLFSFNIPIDDPNASIDENTRLFIDGKFSNGTEASLIHTATDEGTKRLIFNRTEGSTEVVMNFQIALRFGVSTHVDFKLQLEVQNGELSNPIEFRFRRPPGAF